MSNKADWYGLLPQQVRTILIDCNAWVVGSGALWVLGEKPDKPRDLDIVVPPINWLRACRVIGADVHTTFNTYGGCKCIFQSPISPTEGIVDVSVDIWPAHLEEYFSITPKTKEHVAFRWNPRCVVREQIL